MYNRLTRLSLKNVCNNVRVLAPRVARKIWTVPIALTLCASSMGVAMAEGYGTRKRGGGGKGCACRKNVRGLDIRDCQDVITQWFWAWDTLVNDNNSENQEKYRHWIDSHFDDEWTLTVHGDNFVDNHRKDEDYLEFQFDLAGQFISSYSVTSPLMLTEYKYDYISGNEFASFRGTAMGNMGIKATKHTDGKKKMMQTHQFMNLTFIRRSGSNKWKLYHEESTVSVLDINDAP